MSKQDSPAHGPDGLPPPGTIRWVARRKAEVVAAVHGGMLSVDDVCARYNLTLEEFDGWQRAVESSGLAGLRAIQQPAIRDPDGRTEVETPCDQFSAIPVNQDRRDASRFALFLRTAKLLIDDGEQFCIIRDASETGLKVKLFVPLPPHERLLVELANGDQFPVRCVWTSGQNAGLQFVEPVSFERLFNHATDPGRRRHLRLRITLDGLLHLGKTTAYITFHDISPHGAAFKTDRFLLMDELIRIETGILPEIYAKVRWRSHPHYGVIFEQTFQLQELAKRFGDLTNPPCDLPIAQAPRTKGRTRAGGA